MSKVSCPWIDCVLGSGFSLKCSDLEAVTSPLKLLIGGYSDNFEYSRKKHMQHTVYFVNKGGGSQWLCVIFFSEQRAQSFFLEPR